MKKILILFLLGIALSSIVFLGSSMTRDKTKYNNDFVRILPPHAADAACTIDFGVNISLAGISGNVIYVRKNASRNEIRAVDWSLKDTMSIYIDGIDNSEIFIDSPYFFAQNGHLAKVSRGLIKAWSIDTKFDSLPRFTAIQATSKDNLVLRTIDIQKRKNLFIKSSDPLAKHDVLEKQVDGILCTDGHLNYSKEYNRLIYTYRYRNQFIVLDTNLNVVLKGKTIDTTSHARISVVETGGRITMSKPPFVVNQCAAVAGKFLFVNSNLVARNESIEGSAEHSVIDVYNIPDGSYQFSFYIRHLNGSRMRSFTVKDSTLFAVFPQSISRHDIPKVYLRE